MKATNIEISPGAMPPVLRSDQVLIHHMVSIATTI
jgi:hypothetical protein